MYYNIVVQRPTKGKKVVVLDKRGNRLFYLTDTHWIPIGGKPQLLLTLEAAPVVVERKPNIEDGFLSQRKTSRVVETESGSEIKYYDLPKVKDIDGECSECHKYPNFGTQKKLTDLGMKDIIECSECGQLMRPYYLD